MALFGRIRKRRKRKQSLQSLDKREQVIRSHCNLQLDQLDEQRQRVKSANPHPALIAGGAKLAAGISSAAVLNPSAPSARTSPKAALLERAQAAGYSRQQAERAWREAGRRLGVSKSSASAGGMSRLMLALLLLGGLLFVHHFATAANKPAGKGGS